VNGKEHVFTLPLARASQNRLICDVSIAENKKWITKFLKTIEHTYRRTPYFNQAFTLVCNSMEPREHTLAGLLYRSLRVLIEYMAISTRIVESSSIYRNKELSGADRIIDICKREGADIYVNAPGGRHLYNGNFFAENGITLKFLRPVFPAYQRGCGNFIAGLSIIDAIMYCSRAELHAMAYAYELEDAPISTAAIVTSPECTTGVEP
jgi:hypothetical protein